MNAVRKMTDGNNGTVSVRLPFESNDYDLRWEPTLVTAFVDSIDGWIDNDVKLPGQCGPLVAAIMEEYDSLMGSVD